MIGAIYTVAIPWWAGLLGGIVVVAMVMLFVRK